MNTDNQNLKKLTSLLSVIVIGALGSGLWEIILKDLFFKFINFFINSTSEIYGGYLDSIFNRVGVVRTTDVIAEIPGLIFIALIIVAPFFLFYIKIYAAPTSSKASEINVKTIRFPTFKDKKTTWISIIFMYFLASIFYSSVIIEFIVRSNARSYIETSQDIINPFIERDLQLKLIHKYRSITTKSDTVNLISEIINISNQYKINIFPPQIPGIRESELPVINNKLTNNE